MRTMAQFIAAAAAIALVVAGCGDDTCPTESPEVQALAGSDCTVVAGQRVDYPVRLCPTCNQTLSSCDVQISGNNIFVNPVVEACQSASSCGPGCNVNPTTCTFTAPTAAGTYLVSAFDAAHPNTPRTSQLEVVTSGSTSCAL